MEGFQKFILFTAIIVLIIALIFIGIALSYSYDQQWPPMTPQCPDYWTMDGSGSDALCVNVKDLGTCPAQSGSDHLTMDFNSSTFTGANGACAKYTWATNCGISWDGITYGVANPCQTAASSTTTSS